MSKVKQPQVIRCDVCGVEGLKYAYGGPFYPSHGSVTVTGSSVAYNGDVGGGSSTYSDLCNDCLQRVYDALRSKGAL